MLRPETFGQPEQFPEQQQQPTEPTTATTTPPILQPTAPAETPVGSDVSGNVSVGPTFDLAAAQASIAQSAGGVAGSNIPYAAGVEDYLLPPPRTVTDPRFRQADQPESYTWQGHGLVDDDGNILTRENPQTGQQEIYYYVPSVDGMNAYLNSNPDQRARIIDMLEKKGFLMDTYDQIARGYETLFSFANSRGREFASAVRLFEANFPDTEDASPVYSVTSAADLKASIRQSFRNATGQLPNDALIDRFVKMYQEEERTYGQALTTGEGAVEAPPSLAVAGQQFAEQTRPLLVDRQKELGSWNKFFNAIQGPWG
jgi:hypothetical protein